MALVSQPWGGINLLFASISDAANMALVSHCRKAYGKPPCGRTNDDNQRQTMSMEAALQNEVTIKFADMEQRPNMS